MLEAGIYIARRGMMALSLPITDADTAAIAAAVREFVALRRPMLMAE
jgi:glutamate-1-semialdehyde 2,1-aminomutase